MYKKYDAVTPLNLGEQSASTFCLQENCLFMGRSDDHLRSSDWHAAVTTMAINECRIKIFTCNKIVHCDDPRQSTIGNQQEIIALQDVVYCFIYFLSFYLYSLFDYSLYVVWYISIHIYMYIYICWYMYMYFN